MLALYRMSGVPSFLAGPVVVAGLAAVVVVFAVVVVVLTGAANVLAGAVVVLTALSFLGAIFAGAVCAKLNPAYDSIRPAINRIFFITGKFFGVFTIEITGEFI